MARPARLILEGGHVGQALGRLGHFANDLGTQAGDGLAVQLTDTRLAHPHDLADLAQVEVLLIIERHHHFLALGKAANGRDQQLLDAPLFQDARRIGVVIGEMPLEKVLIAIAGKILDIDQLMATCILQGLLVISQRHAERLGQFPL